VLGIESLKMQRNYKGCTPNACSFEKGASLCVLLSALNVPVEAQQLKKVPVLKHGPAPNIRD